MSTSSQLMDKLGDILLKTALGVQQN